MAPLKFRAWHKQESKMYPVAMMGLYGDDSDVYLEGRDLGATGDKVVLMQSTGLTDRNGIEIFEGDVLSIMGERPFRVEWEDKNARFVSVRGSNKSTFV